MTFGKGNVINRSEAAASTDYSYDLLDRLSQKARADDMLDYGYDGNRNRNRPSQTGTQVSQSYSYETGSNRLTGIDAQAFSLDAAGNTLSDAQGRRLEYNAQDQRIRKELPGQKPQVIVYHYDLSGQLLAETTGSGRTIKAYVWLDNRPLAQLSGKGHGNNTRLVYLHTVHLDTPRLGTDRRGNIVWRWDSDAFGNDLGITLIAQDVHDDEHDDDDFDENEGHHKQHKTSQVNLRFPGKCYDQETGLQYN